ncbi:hypothetical protein LNJ08_12240 [Tenacibaculum finnmarkense genomovar ulcerans]|uniref:hypothetical protein n=1 Tax=Tenacibaculum finnmarkense TaxID=2781243 RepID=UPI001E3DBE95|nr:hypothetical protein [Tenacibaculum finnmarkense]MCD8455159.1 hypothetical protein [Tenacibaculum finnmarkense genomovar ulcerans]
MTEKDLTVQDYKKHIRKKYDDFINTKSEKEMLFIKIEILNILNKLNQKSEKTTIDYLGELLNRYIKSPRIKEYDEGIFIMNLEIFYAESELAE